MKQFLILFLFTLSVANGFSQSLFFDNLKNSKWASTDSISSVSISNFEGFGLEKLNVPNDSIKINRTIWSFEDSLIITHYNATSKEETLIGKYEYKEENNSLVITFKNNQPMTYTAGIISSGNFVVLTKKKDKRKKKKRTPNKS